MVTLSLFPLLGMMGLLVDMGYAHYRKQMAKAAAMSAAIAAAISVQNNSGISRCVPLAVLLSPRFAGRMRIDSRGNTVFPHFDAAGLCGYEIKNCGYSGFAAGGQKGLWFSHAQPDDRRLVLTESAIDALSYAALFADAEDQTRYASLGGKPSSRQAALVQATVAKLPAGAEIVAAFDADDAGRKLVAMIREIVAGIALRTERSDLIFETRLPADEGDDWNQVLRNAGLDQTGLAK